MVCYPYARDRFKVAVPNGIKRYWDVLPAQGGRTSLEREMRVQTSMATLPQPRKGGRNRSRRHRLNPARRTVEQNRAVR